MQKNAGFNKKITSYAAALSLLVVWEVLVRIYDMPAYILPGPFRIIKTLAANYDLLAMHTLVTLQEAMLGFAIAAVIALAAGFVLNQIAWLNESIYPLLIVSQSIPIITLAPLFLIWFGWGILPKIIVVVLVCVFPDDNQFSGRTERCRSRSH
jgi:ABC-type nitrate/sulfonate/bicarbonate transport system permease component